MNRPGQGWRRTGSTILLVLVLSAIAAIAVMTFFSTVRQERSRTSKLVQRIRAQAMARRVVARIVALVQQRPWSERFFREDRCLFYSSEGMFKEALPEFTKGDVNYEGSCQQLSAQSKRYRIKLRVKYPSSSLAEKDYSHFSSWDLQYSEGILGNLNRTHILASADSDDPGVPEDELDRQLDLIRSTARQPSNEPQLAGTPGETFVDDVRKAEEQQEGVKAGELGRPPTELLPVPPGVDGANAPGTDPLEPIRRAVEQGLGSPAPAPTNLVSYDKLSPWWGRIAAQSTLFFAECQVNPTSEKCAVFSAMARTLDYGEVGIMDFADVFPPGTVPTPPISPRQQKCLDWAADLKRCYDRLPADVQADIGPCPF